MAAGGASISTTRVATISASGSPSTLISRRAGIAVAIAMT